MIEVPHGNSYRSTLSRTVGVIVLCFIEMLLINNESKSPKPVLIDAMYCFVCGLEPAGIATDFRTSIWKATLIAHATRRLAQHDSAILNML